MIRCLQSKNKKILLWPAGLNCALYLRTCLRQKDESLKKRKETETPALPHRRLIMFIALIVWKEDIVVDVCYHEAAE